MDLSVLLLGPGSVDLGMLIGRVAFGLCFIVHALGKLGIVGPGDMSGFVGWLRSLNVPFPEIQARVSMLAELIGGVLLVLGLLMRPACAVLFITMAVATLIGHKGGGYLITNNPPGREYALNLAILMVTFFILGPGAYSCDWWLFGDQYYEAISVD